MELLHVFKRVQQNWGWFKAEWGYMPMTVACQSCYTSQLW